MRNGTQNHCLRRAGQTLVAKVFDIPVGGQIPSIVLVLLDNCNTPALRDFLVFTGLHLVNSCGGPFVLLPEYASGSGVGASSLHWVADGVDRNSRRIARTTTLVGMASQWLLLATFQKIGVSIG